MKKSRAIAWKGDWPIPKTIRLPGVRITVKLVPTDELEEYGSHYGVWFYKSPSRADILINEDLPVEVQRYSLIHELQHAMNDAVDIMIEKFPEYVQTRSMATLVTTKAKEIADGE